MAGREIVVRHPWERARLAIAMRLIGESLQRTPQLILDIGCGDGYVLSGLQDRFDGCYLIGVDPALGGESTPIRNAAFAAQGTSIRVYGDIREAARSAKGVADVILLMDVLEHVNDDSLFLRDAIANIPTGADTLYFITVPAFMGIFSQHDRELGHFRRYTKNEIEAIAHSADLGIIESGYFFTTLLALRWLQVTWDRLQDGHERNFVGVSAWKYGQPLSDMITSFLELEFFFARRLKKIGLLLPGLSAYAICKTRP